MGEEQRMILEMVRQRTITPEEAVQLLKALAPFAVSPSVSESPAAGRQWMRRGEHDRRDASPAAEPRERNDVGDGETDGKWGFRWGSLSARLSEVLEAAVEKVRGIDFELGDFPWGPVRTVEEVFAGEMDGKRLSVILPHGSVVLTGWDDPGYRIEIRGFVKEDAEAEALRHLRKNIHFRKGEQMVLELEKQRRFRVEVRVFLPRAWLEELTVVAYNGSVQLRNLDVDRLVIHSHNGSIVLQHVVGQQLEAATGNGKLEITDGCFPHASLMSVNGSLDVSAVLEEATCRTVNGQLHVQLQSPAGGRLVLKSTNGSIRVELPENVSVQGEFAGAFGKVYNAIQGVDVLGEVKEWLNYAVQFRTAGVEECQVRLTGNCTNGSVYLLPMSGGGKGEGNDG